jgi:transposase
MAVEGATTSTILEAYVERVLAPALRPGQLVVMDNLGAHRPRRVRELIEGRGVASSRLPAFLLSPDLNPIEEAFAKVEHLLKEIGARTKKALMEAMGRALAVVGAEDARGYFAHCGYRTPAQQL